MSRETCYARSGDVSIAYQVVGTGATLQRAGSGSDSPAFTAPTMPLLARAKRNVGRKLNPSATVSEASQEHGCAYLSIALLIGLLANALLGWWWAEEPHG